MSLGLRERQTGQKAIEFWTPAAAMKEVIRPIEQVLCTKDRAGTIERRTIKPLCSIDIEARQILTWWLQQILTMPRRKEGNINGHIEAPRYGRKSTTVVGE